MLFNLRGCEAASYSEPIEPLLLLCRCVEMEEWQIMVVCCRPGAHPRRFPEALISSDPSHDCPREEE